MEHSIDQPTMQQQVQPEVPPVANQQLQQQPATPPKNEADDESYCGFPMNSSDGKVLVYSINAPLMPWTRYGVLIMAALFFVGAILVTQSLLFSCLTGLAIIGIMVCMGIRLGNAMEAKGMWYPKKLLIGIAVLYFLQTILSDAGTLAESSTLSVVAGILGILLGIVTLIAGNEFKKVYAGNLGRFGNAALVIGAFIIIGGLIAIFTSDSDPEDVSEGMYLIRHFKAFGYVIALLYAAAYYAFLWPLRILAKMMSNHDSPSADPSDEEYFDFNEQKSGSNKWMFAILLIVGSLIVRIIVKVLTH